MNKIPARPSAAFPRTAMRPYKSPRRAKQMKMAFLFPCAEFFMLPKCPEEAIRPMFVPQFQPGLCEPANRSGARGAINEQPWNWLCKRLGFSKCSKPRLTQGVQDAAVVCSYYIFLCRFLRTWEPQALVDTLERSEC